MAIYTVYISKTISLSITLFIKNRKQATVKMIVMRIDRIDNNDDCNENQITMITFSCIKATRKIYFPSLLTNITIKFFNRLLIG